MTYREIPREVIFYYIESNDREPFTEWLEDLKDRKGRRCVLREIRKLEQGSYGNCKPLREGVSELRIFYGPGYRVYLGEHGNKIVILLGGDKGMQEKDIQRAIDYLKDYKNRQKLS